MSKFTSGYNKGFRMTFENGFSISVQWGVGNYCEKRDSGEWNEATKHDFWSSNSAEIAVFNKEGRDSMIPITGYTLENTDGTEESYTDVVSGWLSTDTVAKCITIVQSATTKEEIETKMKALNL
tara:strand:- start:83 stop:454 length:372 start_codon:yes stop_codon:yes gene_type:complete